MCDRVKGVSPGDEVIVPSNTYIATWLAVSQCGATPVPVEPVEATFNIDPARIEAAITPATRMILTVHLYGQPADLEPILAIARKHGCACWRTPPRRTARATRGATTVLMVTR